MVVFTSTIITAPKKDKQEVKKKSIFKRQNASSTKEYHNFALAG